ncbi:MAG: cysteine desulfurase family protein [Gemmatimonadales bacterium]
MTQQSPPIYLDHAANTPVLPEVREALEPFLSGEVFGHPSSVHRPGQATRAIIERARREIAEVLQTAPSQIVFTSGGTEADNIAVIGAALAARAAGKPIRVAVSAIEHKAVLETAHAVSAMGGEIITLPVDVRGQVETQTVDDALARGVAVVSIMWVNNETGVIQDVAELARRCEAAGVPFHTDAVQSFGKIPIDLTEAPNAMVSLSGHKIGAINGVGILVVPDPSMVAPLFYGGGQQLGLRPGTENALGAVAMATAIRLAPKKQPQFEAHTLELRDTLERLVTTTVMDAVMFGAQTNRAPHISSMGFPGADSESLLMQLDLAGIAGASGSACNTGVVTASHVLTAMHADPAAAVGALRFSFALSNTMEEVERTAAMLPEIVEKTRMLTASLERS